MFCDQTNIIVSAGAGGDGCISFHRERSLAKGGPDGGDGGNGGDIILQADENLNTLIELHTKKKLIARNGNPGKPKNMNGSSAKDKIISVPVGTKIKNFDTEEVLADLRKHRDACIVALGGKGGHGNAHFTSSIRQAPRFAELGEPGETKNISLELVLVADVGIIGLPSAGKSTLISTITAAKPKIGNFPFTTLVPNLGVAKLSDSRSLVFCDLPGLISGASQGKGLGHKFLQHISRNHVLLHLIDITADNPAQNYKNIRSELKKYDFSLLHKPEIIVLSKIDILGGDQYLLEMLINDFSKQISIDTSCIFPVSSWTHGGIQALLERSFSQVQQEKKKMYQEHFCNNRERVVFRPHISKNAKSFQLREEKNGFRVLGQRIQQIVIQSDFQNREALLRVRDVLKKMGIESALIKQGAERGTPIYIGNKILEFQPSMLKKRGTFSHKQNV
jgi:GTP-binding protein